MPPKSPGFQRKSAFYEVYTCFDGNKEHRTVVR